MRFPGDIQKEEGLELIRSVLKAFSCVRLHLSCCFFFSSRKTSNLVQFLCASLVSLSFFLPADIFIFKYYSIKPVRCKSYLAKFIASSSCLIHALRLLICFQFVIGFPLLQFQKDLVPTLCLSFTNNSLMLLYCSKYCIVLAD